MSTPILATKLFIPPTRPKIVRRPRLIRQLNEGLHHKLTLISASAGFGKTTLVSEWVHQKDKGSEMKADNSLHPSSFILHPSRVAWLSLDEGDNDPARFLAYLVAALQRISPTIGQGVITLLQSPQPPPIESVLTAVLNEIATIPEKFILVLDDYHLIDARSIDRALTFLLEHLPTQMHLVITTREDPPLPLARLRARDQLTELRVADLRFTPDEAAGFLNLVMGLNLSAEEIAALEMHTEGWIAGLQLAAISMQGQKDAASFIQSFTGSHHYVLDYLVEEVLQQQPESIQTFLLNTSILDRLCGSLCDAVLRDSAVSGQETLLYLEQANLFIVPLDNERHWYRYHHLFANFLRQRLQKIGNIRTETLHGRASQWYEENGLEIEAFHHAAAANDVERAGRLIEGQGMPLHFRGVITPVMNWLASLPTTILDARPSLWVTYASVLTMTGQPISSVEEKLQAAEAALQNAEPNDMTRDLIGQIAAIRAMLAIPQNQVEVIIVQSLRALEFLHPDNLPVRTTATWTLGIAHQFQRNHAAAIQAFTEVISISEASGNIMVTIAASTCLGQVQEAENQLYLAAESYQRCLQLAGDPPWPAACEAYLGLARITYQWNDLDRAHEYGQQSLELARRMETVDTPAVSEVFLARLKLAGGDVAGAARLLTQAEEFMHQRNIMHRMPEVVAAQVLTLIRQGDLETAVQLAEKYELPLSRARVHLALGDVSTALSILAPWRQQVEATGWADELLKVLVLQAVVHQAYGETETAVQLLGEALSLAKPGGFIRIFIDEGSLMAELLTRMKDENGRPVSLTGSGRTLSEVEGMKKYIDKLLAVFGKQKNIHPSPFIPQPLVEPLSQRELEVLQLVAQGLSNREISERLFLALDTVKGHNRRIFGKLQVRRRTEAVARARELGLL